MFCKECGKKIPDDAQFCFNCGTAVDKPSVESKQRDNSNEQKVIEEPHVLRNSSEKKNISDVLLEDVNISATNKIPLWVIVIVVAVIFIFLIFLFVLIKGNKSDTDLSSSNMASYSSSDSSDQTKKEITEVPLSSDLKAISSYKYKDKDPEYTYYVYDDNRNLEYEVSIAENKDCSTYTLFHYVYNDMGQELITQFEYLMDYCAEWEAQGLDDDLISGYSVCQYDKNGNKISEYIPPDQYIEYTYDSNNRVSIVTHNDDDEPGNRYTEKYEYDENGNKVRELHEFETGQSYTYEYQYDNAGKLIKSGAVSYQYDDEGHLIKEIRSDSTRTYTYITDPKESRQYLEKIKNVFDLNQIEKEANDLLEKYHGISSTEGSGPSQDINTEQDEYNVDQSNNVLPENVFNNIKGTYWSGVNFIILRFISPSEIIREDGETSSIRIDHYDYIGNELVLYLDTGNIITSYSDENGNMCLCLREGGGWDYEKSHEYAVLERLSTDTAISTDEVYQSDEDSNSTLDSQTAVGNYSIRGTCQLLKVAGEYYLYPGNNGDTLWQGYNDTGITFNEGLKISRNAKVGIATSMDFVDSGYDDGIEEPLFTYEYRNFYDVVDELYTTMHWQSLDAGHGLNAFAFKIDDMVIFNTPEISLNEKGEIILLLDFYHE